MSKPRLIAFYLPQFYPTKENDEWWAPGFTEWTNVGRAKPLFPGHYQPRVPADLGYYDLRVPETREKQAELAREAGIEGFCYWHYWFAGRRLLDRVFTEVVESGKPDFPFCLCWANHSWYKKVWNPEVPDKLLIEQTYPGEQDYIEHFYALLPAFKDPRYMKVNGKLIFGVFSPFDISDINLFVNTWNTLATENGLAGFCFVAFSSGMDNGDVALTKGYDAVCVDFLTKMNEIRNPINEIVWKFVRKFTNYPKYMTYNQYSKKILKSYVSKERYYPCIAPNFDHSPRSKNRGVVLRDSTPRKWEGLCKKLFAMLKDKKPENNLVFIKAWNEWGEGNYMEPDLKYGKGYINALKEAMASVR